MPRPGDEPFEIEGCEVLKVLDSSILVKCSEWDKPQFVPTSQLHEDNDLNDEGDRGTLIVTMWLAEERGWA